jgi:hypothetical protein
MQKRLLAFILSLSIHLLILLLIRALSAQSPARRAIRIDLVQETATPPAKSTAQEDITRVPEKREEPEIKPDLSKTPDSHPIHSLAIPGYVAWFDSLYEGARLSADSSSLYNQEAWKQFVLKKIKEHQFTYILPLTPSQDSQAFAFAPEDWDKHPVQGDDVADQIYRRNTGVTPLPSLWGLLSKIVPKQSDKEPDPQFDFIPTETQVRAMDMLYTKKKATQLELYPLLDTSRPITAEGLNRQLEALMEKGFVSRKKISPEYHFMLFGTPIEISSKNRKNPLYVYETKVDRKKLLDFLQAQLFLNMERLRAQPADSVAITSRIHDLQQKIQVLVE